MTVLKYDILIFVFDFLIFGFFNLIFVLLSFNIIHFSHRLVAVSKKKPVEAIQACYDDGHRDFGENYVDEFIGKVGELPQDIRWFVQ